jgi:nicotinamide-nucleotide amidase
VPRELEYLMKRRVIPYLKERAGTASVIKARVLRTCVIGESQIDALIGDLMTGGNPTVGLAAHSGQVDIRITAKAADEAAADGLIAPVEAELRDRLGSVIYGEGTEELGEMVGRLLAEQGLTLAPEQGLTLALVDSVTQGEVAERLRNTQYAGVLVSNEVPTGDEGSPEEAGANAERLAERARTDAGASLGLAALGTVQAGDDRPLVYLALSDRDGLVTRSYPFGLENKLMRRWLSIRALDLVRRYLIGALDEEIG